MSAQGAFKEFLGIEQFTLVKANISMEKNYYNAYKSFKNSIILPENYLSNIYSSKYAQHFYTKKEIDVFKDIWRKKEK